jgi:N-acetyl-anhydromuramyl-L-alanine amidase AmpD
MTRPPEPPVPADNAAAGAQPGPIPRIDNHYRAPEGSYYPGRAGRAIKYLIRHDTEAQSDSDHPSLAWFLFPASGVSIHHLITRAGVRLDMVFRVHTAFHCGVASYGTDGGSVVLDPQTVIGALNLCSVGMEFESTATASHAGNGYTDAQLWCGAYTEACSILTWPGLVVLDHRQIAQPPGRRVDPSHFPLAQYLSYVRDWTTFLRTVPVAARGHYFL